MTALSTVCPQCSGEIEQGDRFCQDCGCQLVGGLPPVTPLKLSSPLLGRSMPRALSELPTPAAVQQKPSKSIWRALPLAIGAEFLLVAAMFAYTGTAIFWLDKRHPELMHVKPKHAQKAAVKLDDRQIFISYRQPVLSQELRELITQAQIVGAQRDRAVERRTEPVSPVGQGDLALQMQKHHHQPGTAIGAAPAAAPASAAAVPTEKAPVKIAATGIKAVADRVESAPSGQVAEFAEYNRLLADYFSRRQKQGGVRSGEADPPSFQEWVDANKPNF